jgi:hypothetical protein
MIYTLVAVEGELVWYPFVSASNLDDFQVEVEGGWLSLTLNKTLVAIVVKGWADIIEVIIAQLCG